VVKYQYNETNMMHFLLSLLRIKGLCNVSSITCSSSGGARQTTLGILCACYVSWLATDWKVRGSNPGGGEIFCTHPDWPWGPLSLLYNRYRVFPGGKCGRGVVLTTHPLLAPRPLVACYRVTFMSVGCTNLGLMVLKNEKAKYTL
jgi:hypothetical protein